MFYYQAIYKSIAHLWDEIKTSADCFQAVAIAGYLFNVFLKTPTTGYPTISTKKSFQQSSNSCHKI